MGQSPGSPDDGRPSGPATGIKMVPNNLRMSFAYTESARGFGENAASPLPTDHTSSRGGLSGVGWSMDGGNPHSAGPIITVYSLCKWARTLPNSVARGSEPANTSESVRVNGSGNAEYESFRCPPGPQRPLCPLQSPLILFPEQFMVSVLFVFKGDPSYGKRTCSTW